MFDPVHPGEVLKEDVLAEAGLTVARAAEILGVGRPALSAVHLRPPPTLDNFLAGYCVVNVLEYFEV